MDVVHPRGEDLDMRYTGPTTRINRRYKLAVFPLKKAYERKPYLPGIHGVRLKRRVTEYSTGLNEKQKLRYMFGLTEQQFRKTFAAAKKIRGVTGEIMLRLLECRLDNVVYTMGFAKTRRAARQFVNHGHIMVNGHKVDIPSYTCIPGDEIKVCDKISSKQLSTRFIEESQYRPCPAWISVNSEVLHGVINRYPIREEMVQNVNEQLVIEFYSR
jgi:small subunit ribosomal protein S4